MRDQSDQHLSQLEELITERTKDFESSLRQLQDTYDRWIKDLEKYRYDNNLLKLFSNRQIMIMIILLNRSTAQNSIQRQFFEKIFQSNDLQKQTKLTILCLIHYLQSLRINDCDLSEDNVGQLYEQHRIDAGSATDAALKQLSQFLRELFPQNKEWFAKNPHANENQQYLVTVNSIDRRAEKNDYQTDLDADTYCVLVNIFSGRLPAGYQILWCSAATEVDIRSFFSRVRTFHQLTFAVLEIDQMHHRLRTLLFSEQDHLHKREKPHGSVYYFSRELTISRKGLRPFSASAKYRSRPETHSQLMRLMQLNHLPLPEIHVIHGVAGIGKPSFHDEVTSFTLKLSFVCRENTSNQISIP